MDTPQNKTTITNHTDEILQSVFPKLSFPCYVNGQKLTATYLGQTDDAIVDFQFEFSFSDGYSTVFFCTGYGKWSDANNSNSNYLEAIKDDLSTLLLFTSVEKTIAFPVKYNNTNFNVFVFKDCTTKDGFPYSVYYKGEYRFHLEKINGEWLAKSVCVIDSEKIDNKLVSIITKELESR